MAAAVFKDKDMEPHPMIRLIDPARIPAHVAIIMDGNGRWAKSRDLPRIEGHKAGIDAVRASVEAATELKVGHLTLYAFSVENWKRPPSEVTALFRLLNEYLTAESQRIVDQGIRFRVMGRLQDIKPYLRKKLSDLVLRTKDAPGMTLSLALSYGGRTEIADACSAILSRAQATRRTGPVTVEEFAEHLYLPGLPDPDLLIRTSGEYRLSNFLLWQVAYTELCILDVLWPDFRKEHFYEAILDFQRRKRRYGGIAGEERPASRRKSR